MDKALEWCELCATVGKRSKLKVYQINFKEAVKLCEDEACNYPISVDKLVSRKFEDVPLPLRRKNVHKQASFQTPNFSSNCFPYVPRPRPVVLSAQAPGNIIRPQPVSALPQTNGIVPPSPYVSQLPQQQKQNGLNSRVSLGVLNSMPRKSTPLSFYSSVDNVHISSKSSFHSVHKTVPQPSVHSSSFNDFTSSLQVLAQSEKSNLPQTTNTFISPEDEIDIDTSEVTEVIDIHFNSDELLALAGEAPKQIMPSLSSIPCQTNIPSPVKGSAESRPSTPVIQCADAVVPSSPFIPVRSNLGNISSEQKSVEKHTSIKPMGSNNIHVIDNVISQEFEIETSSNTGSPLLGEKTTYFVIQNTGKRRGRKPKPKDENLKPVRISEKEVKSGEIETDKQVLPTIEKKSSISMPTFDIYKYFPQWQNEEALCWLDVVLCLYVHSKTIRKIQVDNDNIDLSHTILVTLYKAYQQACKLVNKYREKAFKDNFECASRTRSGRLFSDPEESDSDAVTDSPNTEMMKEICKFSSHEVGVKTGAGLSCSKDFMSMLPSGDQENYKTAFTILRDIRETIWKKLQPRLQCVKGKNDSPVLAIPLIVKDSIHCEKNFSVEYDFIFTCNVCGYKQTDRYWKVLPTFPCTEKNFTMKDPYFIRPCFKCNAEGQHRLLKFNKLQGALMLHFAEGLSHNNFKKLEFWHGGLKYGVTGFVQYRNDPDHFVTWIRRQKDNKWLEFDDLKSPICKFESRQTDIDSKQIHIVMWEPCKANELDRHSSHVVNGEKTNLDACSSTTWVVPNNHKMKTVSSKGQNPYESRNVCDSVCAEVDKQYNLNQKQSDTVKTTSCSQSLHVISKESIPKISFDEKINTNIFLSKTVGTHQEPLFSEESDRRGNEVVVPSVAHVTEETRTKLHNKLQNSCQHVAEDTKTRLHKKLLKSVQQNTVETVRKARLENKTTGKISPQDRSEQIIKNVIKNMSEDSNLIFTPKTESKITLNKQQEVDRKKALAKLWKPKPEALTKIRKANSVREKKNKEGAEENTWKPVDKIKLTEQKYSRKSSQHQEESFEVVYPKSGNAQGTMTNLIIENEEEKVGNCSIPPNVVQPKIHKRRSKYMKHNDSESLANGNGLESNGKKRKSRCNSSESSEKLHVIVAQQEPVKSNVSQNFSHSKKSSFQKLELEATVNGNMNIINGNVLETNSRKGVTENNYGTFDSRSNSRCSTSVFSRFSAPSKTFSGYRQKSFSGFQSATFNKPCQLPSPTPSTKSELVFPSKRKTSISNFITVKRPKFQISSNFSTPSCTPMSLIPSSLRSSQNGGNPDNESDILQNLYNALDIPVPNNNPDSLDLSAIENSSCLQNMDDFLDHLL